MAYGLLVSKVVFASPWTRQPWAAEKLKDIYQKMFVLGKIMFRVPQKEVARKMFGSFRRFWVAFFKRSEHPNFRSLRKSNLLARLVAKLAMLLTSPTACWRLGVDLATTIKICMKAIESGFHCVGLPLWQKTDS